MGTSRNHRHALQGVAVALAVVACGGSTSRSTSNGAGGSAGSNGVGGVSGSGATGAGGTGGDGTGASSGSGGSPVIELRRTSYDVRFEGVAVDGTLGTLPSAESPSQGASLRVDIGARVGDTYQAFVTPRWGYPAEATTVFELESGRVELTTGFFITGAEIGDTWSEMMVSLDANGELRGPVTATGHRRPLGGDFGGSFPLEASGSIALDRTAPEVDAVTESPHGPPDALLPWDEVVVRAAEGVDADELHTLLRILSATGENTFPAVHWKHTPAIDDRTAPSGSVRVRGSFQTWPDLSLDLGVGIDAGAMDLVGLRAPVYSKKFTLRSFGSAAGRNDFDGTGPALALWGQTVQLGGAAGPDPRCESKGCMMIGPLANPHCSVRSGFAGRITTSSPLISIRYRVLVGPITPGSSEPPSYSPPMHFDLASPGREVTLGVVYIEPSALRPLAEPQGELRWGTEWRTEEVAVRTGDIGYSVYAGVTSCAPRGGPVPNMPIAIFVDRIESAARPPP